MTAEGMSPGEARARFVARLAHIMNPDPDVDVGGVPCRTAVARPAPKQPATRKRRTPAPKKPI